MSRPTGWIAGVGIASLLYVSLALLAVTAVYQAAEWIAGRLSDFGRRVAITAVLVVAFVVFARGGS